MSMRRYVSRCNVMMNGAMVENLKNFKIGEEVLRKEVELMNTTGSVEVTPRYKFSLDYAVPKIGARMNWLNVEDATFVIELQGGTRLSYSGVDCLSQGELTIDGEKEAVRTINFIAASKNED